MQRKYQRRVFHSSSICRVYAFSDLRCLTAESVRRVCEVGTDRNRQPHKQRQEIFCAGAIFHARWPYVAVAAPGRTGQHVSRVEGSLRDGYKEAPCFAVAELGAGMRM